MAEPKIFVGGLPKDCVEQLVTDHFSQFGEVQHVEVKRDRETNNSRGFGFVTFSNWETYGRVLDAINSHEIEGKWVEVKPAVARDSAPAGPPAAPSPYQPPKGGCKGSCKGSGKKGGYAALPGPAPAQAWGGGKSWDFAWGKGGGAKGQPAPRVFNTPKPTHEFNAAKIFVGGLPKADENEVEALVAEVQNYFMQFGNPTNVEIKKDPTTGRSRGFGFVTFDDEASVPTVMEQYDSHQLRGKWIEVKSANPDGTAGPAPAKGGKGPPPRPSAAPALNDAGHAFQAEPLQAEECKVFVGHLPKNCDEAKLTETLSVYGNVTEVLVKRGPEGQTRGFAFVTFDSPEPIQALMENHANNMIDGQWIDVKAATAKGGDGMGGGKGAKSGGKGPGGGKYGGCASSYGPAKGGCKGKAAKGGFVPYM